MASKIMRVLILAACGGCGQVTQNDWPTDSSGGSGAEVTNVLDCEAIDVGSQLGMLESSGSLSGPGGSALCGADASNAGTSDIAYAWQAPSSGCFRFGLWSDVEYELRLSERSCGGREIHCSRAFGTSTAYRFAKDEVVVLSLSSVEGSRGAYYELGVYADDGPCEERR